MTDVYIEINGVERFAGVFVPEQAESIQTTRVVSHESLDKVAAQGAYYIEDYINGRDKILIYGVDGDYSDADIEAMVADPWSLFKPAAPKADK